MVIAFFLLSASYSTSQSISIDDPGKVYNLRRDLEVLKAAIGNHAINGVSDAIQYGDFSPSQQNIPHFITGNIPAWCRFKVENLTGADILLEVKNPDISKLDIFIAGDSGLIEQQINSGNTVPVADRLIKQKILYIPLNLPVGETKTIYIYCESDKSEIYLPISLGTLTAFYSGEHWHDLMQGLFLGLILFVFIYNFFLFFTLKKFEYLYFSLFVTCIGAFFGIINGYGIEFYWEEWTVLSRYVGLIASMAGIFMILFTSYFLKSRFTTPRRHIWLLSLAGLYIVSILLNIYGASYVAIRFIHFNTSFTILFLLFTAITVLKRGYRPAFYYIISLAIFIIGYVLFLLRENNLIPISNFSEYVLQIGSTLSIISMTFALGRKINEYIDKRDEARALALKASMQNERLIAHQNQMLETRVTERTKDLEQTIHTLQKQREALADANQFKDKVFSVISHDLKSPLSTLGGLLNVLKVNNLDENEKEKILNNVQLALKNTRNLLDNILIWATRKRDTKPEGSLFDIYLVVEENFELFQPQAEAKSLSLINEIPSGYQVYGDRNMLQLVLRNLVSNAIKFTKERGKIWVMIKPDNDDVCILVKDSGIGISPENQKKLFDDNHHFTTRGTNNEKGTGLGLRLCREYIEKQGGTISVESAKDQGTTFKIVLKHAHMPLEKV